MQPLSCFVTALPGTADAVILAEVESRIGSRAELITLQDKSTFRVVLTLYLHCRKYTKIESYTLRDAITDILNYVAPSMYDVILASEGISDDNAEGLIEFLEANLHCTVSRS